MSSPFFGSSAARVAANWAHSGHLQPKTAEGIQSISGHDERAVMGFVSFGPSVDLDVGKSSSGAGTGESSLLATDG